LQLKADAASSQSSTLAGLDANQQKLQQEVSAIQKVVGDYQGTVTGDTTAAGTIAQNIQRKRRKNYFFLTEGLNNVNNDLVQKETTGGNELAAMVQLATANDEKFMSEVAAQHGTNLKSIASSNQVMMMTRHARNFARF
jgi:hypothetical protein